MNLYFYLMDLLGVQGRLGSWLQVRKGIVMMLHLLCVCVCFFTHIFSALMNFWCHPPLADWAVLLELCPGCKWPVSICLCCHDKKPLL
jgi:hypothetical protein